MHVPSRAAFGACRHARFLLVTAESLRTAVPVGNHRSSDMLLLLFLLPLLILLLIRPSIAVTPPSRMQIGSTRQLQKR
eukprot:7541067-Pyramimonas_sp.AAC.1